MDTIENLIADVSRISQNISPHILEKYGLITALDNFINQIRLTEKIKFFDTFEKTNRFDLKTELTIYRTVTELINNSIKHSGADEIHIKIFLSGNCRPQLAENLQRPDEKNGGKF
jgi:signal transduction histidine kinase